MSKNAKLTSRIDLGYVEVKSKVSEINAQFVFCLFCFPEFSKVLGDPLASTFLLVSALLTHSVTTRLVCCMSSDQAPVSSIPVIQCSTPHLIIIWLLQFNYILHDYDKYRSGRGRYVTVTKMWTKMLHQGFHKLIDILNIIVLFLDPFSFVPSTDDLPSTVRRRRVSRTSRRC